MDTAKPLKFPGIHMLTGKIGTGFHHKSMISPTPEAMWHRISEEVFGPGVVGESDYRAGRPNRSPVNLQNDASYERLQNYGP